MLLGLFWSQSSDRNEDMVRCRHVYSYESSLKFRVKPNSQNLGAMVCVVKVDSDLSNPAWTVTHFKSQ